MTNEPPEIAVENVTVQFGQGPPIFRALSCKFDGDASNKGRIVAIMGPSGVGKSTILQLIGQAGFRNRNLKSGEVRLKNADVVSYVPQEPVLLTSESFEYNLDLFGRVTALKNHWNQNERESFVRLLRLDSLRTRRSLTSISGGEKQRVMLARTLAIHPSVMLLDEPMSSLDQSIRIPLITELRGVIVDRGILALYVTHDIGEARLIADEILYLEPGPNSVTVEGRSSSVQTKEFIEAPPTLKAAYAVFYPFFGTIPVKPGTLNKDSVIGLTTRVVGVDGQNVRLGQDGIPIRVVSMTSETVFVSPAVDSDGHLAIPIKRSLFPPLVAVGDTTCIGLDGLFQFDSYERLIRPESLRGRRP